MRLRPDGASEVECIAQGAHGRAFSAERDQHAQHAFWLGWRIGAGE
jgi:hypothetical protein